MECKYKVLTVNGVAILLNVEDGREEMIGLRPYTASQVYAAWQRIRHSTRKEVINAALVQQKQT